jgi:hypothetical protein
MILGGDGFNLLFRVASFLLALASFCTRNQKKEHGKNKEISYCRFQGFPPDLKSPD